MQRAFVSRGVPLLLIALLACGACGASMRTKALRVNLVALNTARDSVITLMAEREKQIYDACNPPTCTKEEGHARVDAWRVKVDVALKAIDIGYRAIHDAALLDDVKSEGEARAALAKALALFKELKDLKETP